MKEKEPRQTVCNEPTENAKNPYCGGKLKLISALEPELAKQAGKGNNLLRCQICRTLYTEPSPYAAVKR